MEEKPIGVVMEANVDGGDDDGRYYHFCQHPETLSMDTLEPRGLFLSHNDRNWSSPHLVDIVTYEVTLKPGTKLKQIYCSCDFEFLDREDLILQYMDEGYDGIEHRFGLEDAAVFQKGGLYEDFEWVTSGKENPPMGDSSSDQIFLFRATDSVESIIVSRPSDFQMATQFIEVVLPRKALPSLEENSIADIRDSLECRRLLLEYAPRGHYFRCWYELNPRTIKLRYIPRPVLEIETLNLENARALARLLYDIRESSNFPM